MAKFNVVDMNGQHVSEIELSDAVFGITPNEKAVHEAVVNFLANQRQGTQNTKIRKEVRGGGKKPQVSFSEAQMPSRRITLSFLHMRHMMSCLQRLKQHYD